VSKYIILIFSHFLSRGVDQSVFREARLNMKHFYLFLDRFVYDNAWHTTGFILADQRR